MWVVIMKPQSLFWVLLVLLLLSVPIVSADDPWANFTPSNITGTAPYTVTFVSISYNDPTAWNWSYRDTTGNNTEVWFSQLKNATLTFYYGGDYAIRLNSSNTDGYNITPTLAFVNVFGPSLPNATPNSTPGSSTTTFGSCTSNITGALNIIGILLTMVGLVGILYTLLSVGGFSGGRSNYGAGQVNTWLLIGSILAILVGAVMLIMAYLIVSAAMGMSVACV